MGARERSDTRTLLLVVACFALAACSASTPTPIIVVVTPEPTPIIVYVTPSPSPVIVYVTPSPSATPEQTATLEPTPAPTPLPTSAASSCSGSASNQAFFAQAAKGLKFTVYCAAGLPSGWAIASGAWEGSGGGVVSVIYRYRSTATSFDLYEGPPCSTDPPACSSTGNIGTASFGGMTAYLFLTAAGQEIHVAPATRIYKVVGHGVDVTTLMSFAANMRAVPKT